MKRKRLLSAFTLISISLVYSSCTNKEYASGDKPILIREQGSFAVGGSVIQSPGTFDPVNNTSPAGQTFHGDHAYVFYRIPQDARQLPLVFWHGYGQFPKDSDSLEQYFRQMTPDTGPIDIDVNSDAVAELFEKIGPGILVTHSHSGGMGWDTVLKTDHIRAIISYEPGSNFVFPEGEVPPALPSSSGSLEAVGIPMPEFKKLTQIPIIIYYGDNIPEQRNDENPGQDGWRVRLEMTRLWAEAVNRHGGDVTVVHLPEIGIHGNTHFPFSDLNNVEIADLMSGFLNEKGLN
ncbi:MAG: alpha/beta hydrolase [Puniceicoccaceae bacterium]|nr:alpha/beta hydrolase [Puniceicoccaceae bacterium]|tara:strand:+ start:8981 stop:9853 length:873 start_codon:yes stop_codon:yes gene_type:complete